VSKIAYLKLHVTLDTFQCTRKAEIFPLLMVEWWHKQAVVR